MATTDPRPFPLPGTAKRVIVDGRYLDVEWAELEFDSPMLIRDDNIYGYLNGPLMEWMALSFDAWETRLRQAARCTCIEGNDALVTTTAVVRCAVHGKDVGVRP